MVSGAINPPPALLDANLLRIIRSEPVLSQATERQIMRLLDG